MPLLGYAHISLLIGVAGAAILLAVLCRRDRGSRGGVSRIVRFALGFGLAANELIWWAFRYSHEGVHRANLPLQLCDLTVWSTVWACIKPVPIMVEFAYFAGLAGAGMALLTPDLWSPWPSYPAIYFFVAHGGVVVAVAVLVFGGAAPLRQPGARLACCWFTPRRSAGSTQFSAPTTCTCAGSRRTRPCSMRLAHGRCIW